MFELPAQILHICIEFDKMMNQISPHYKRFVFMCADLIALLNDENSGHGGMSSGFLMAQ